MRGRRETLTTLAAGEMWLTDYFCWSWGADPVNVETAREVAALVAAKDPKTTTVEQVLAAAEKRAAKARG